MEYKWKKTTILKKFHMKDLIYLQRKIFKSNIKSLYTLIQDKNVIYLDETQIKFLLTILTKSKDTKCALNIKLFILLYYGVGKMDG